MRDSAVIEQLEAFVAQGTERNKRLAELDTRLERLEERAADGLSQLKKMASQAEDLVRLADLNSSVPLTATRS